MCGQNHIKIDKNKFPKPADRTDKRLDKIANKIVKEIKKMERAQRNNLYEKGLELYKHNQFKKAASLFSEGLNEGDPRCIYAYGVCVFYGKGVEKNEEKGKEIILKCLPELERWGKDNAPHSNGLLHLAFSKFDFIENERKNFEALDRLYNFQRKEMDCEQLFDYALCYKYERGAKQDCALAHNIFEECYDKYHHLGSLFEIADDYITDVDKNDITYAIKLLQKGASEDINNEFDFRMKLFVIYFGDSQTTSDFKSAEQIAIEALEIVKHPVDLTQWNFLLFAALFMEGKTNQAFEFLDKVNFCDYNESLASLWSQLNQTHVFGFERDDFEKMEQLNNIVFERLSEYKVNPYFILSFFYDRQADAFYDVDSEERKALKKKEYEILKDGIAHLDDDCMHFYARHLLYGDDIPLDISTGFELIKKCCEITDDYSKFILLGQCYENGLGIQKNHQLAYQSFLKAFYFEPHSVGNNIHKITAALYILFLSNCIVISKEVLDEVKYFLATESFHASLQATFIFSDAINQNNSELLSWVANYSNSAFGDASNLIDSYRYGIGVKKDLDKAIELYENDSSIYGGESLYEIGKIYYDGVEKPKNLDLAEKYFLKANEDKDKNFVRLAEIHLFYIYSNKNSGKYDIAKAIMHLLAAANEEENNDYFINEAFYELGLFYQTKDFGMYDLNLAKKYYEKAKEHGLNCEYVIESVERDLILEKYQEEGFAIGKQQNKFGRELTNFAREYARDKYASSTNKGLNNCVKRMLHTGVKGNERKIYITNELQDDFKELWEDLKDNAKQTLITAIFTYSNFVESGYECYADLDFSQVVNGVSKAFEIELKEFFSTGLLKYLLANDVDYEEFVNEATNTQVPFIDTRIEIKDGVPINYYSYSKTEESKNFSLGQVYFILTIGQNRNYFNGMLDQSKLRPGIKTRQAVLSGDTINPHIIDYFDELFSEDAFSDFHRREEIANYLIDLANDVKTIKNKRNPGAHDDVLTVDDAELCADYLVKIRHPIYDFLSRIKKEYRKGFYIK